MIRKLGDETKVRAEDEERGEGEPPEFRLRSPAFDPGDPIPRRFTCDGDDRLPPLSWEGAPEGVASYALICDDPDAPARPWVHWVAYDIPAEETGLPEGVRPEETITSGGKQGMNSFGRPGYGGPCPPEAHGPHRYVFKVYALDARLDLEPGAGKEEVLAAMRGHVLDHAELTGTYERG